MSVKSQTSFSQTHIIAKFVLPYICSCLLYLDQLMIDVSIWKTRSHGVYTDYVSRLQTSLERLNFDERTEVELATLVFLYCKDFMKNLKGMLKVCFTFGTEWNRTDISLCFCQTYSELSALFVHFREKSFINLNYKRRNQDFLDPGPSDQRNWSLNCFQNSFLYNASDQSLITDS